MSFEEGEIEEGEVAEEGEVRDDIGATNGESAEKRKATSPIHQDENAEKRLKVEQENGDAEEGECVSDDEIETEPMDIDKHKVEDGELELDLSDVELFKDKQIADLVWDDILPEKVGKPEENRNLLSTRSILKNSRVERHSSYLIRNEELKISLENALGENSEIREKCEIPSYSSISVLIRKNRDKLGLSKKIPLRPFLPPTRFNGALAHQVTQFILDQDP